MIIDTHAHLNVEQYKNDLEEVIKNAYENDCKKIIIIGMDDLHNKKAIEIAQKYDNLYATIGIHPCDVEKEDLESLDKFIGQKKLVAIGEIGIDLYWNKTNLDKQIKYFKYQMDFAYKHNLPVIIHTRESFQETYEVAKLYKNKVKGVFHAFSSSFEDMQKAIEIGFHIGIGGVVTFSKRGDLEKIVQNVPLDRLLIETDSPYLTPKPFRGKRNEPAYTKYVVEEIAKIRNLDQEYIKEVTTKNAIALFGLE